MYDLRPANGRRAPSPRAGDSPRCTGACRHCSAGAQRSLLGGVGNSNPNAVDTSGEDPNERVGSPSPSPRAVGPAHGHSDGGVGNTNPNAGGYNSWNPNQGVSSPSNNDASPTSSPQPSSPASVSPAASPSPGSPAPTSPSITAPGTPVGRLHAAGLPFVVNSEPVVVFTELAPVVEALISDPVLMAAVVTCSETVGIPEIAANFADNMFSAVMAFKTYGFCALRTLREQQMRLQYMNDYAMSITLKAELLDKHNCSTRTAGVPDLEAMPEECFLHTYIEASLNATAALYRQADGDKPFCSDADTSSNATLLMPTLADDYVPQLSPKYRCVVRPPLPL